MTATIDTINKAIRHGLALRFECPGCGLTRVHSLVLLMQQYGGGRDPLSLPLKCPNCRPVLTLIERPPGRTIAQTIASETGAHVAVLDPIEGVSSDAPAGTDYFTIMRANLATLRAGQECAEAADGS